MSDGKKIDSVELKKMVNALNETGLLDKKIKTVGVSKDDLATAFTDNIEALEDDDVEKLPDEVIDFYNEHFGDDEDGDGDSDGDSEADADTPPDEDEEEEAPKKSKGKSKPKEEEEAPKKGKGKAKAEEPKKAKGKAKDDAEDKPKRKFGKWDQDAPKSRYGHNLGTQAEKLDEILYKGATLKDAAEKIESKITRVQSHIQWLKNVRGLTVVCEDGVYRVEEEKWDPENGVGLPHPKGGKGAIPAKGKKEEVEPTKKGKK